MIKVTREFATVEEAAAWLMGGQAPAPHFAPNVAAPAPQPVVTHYAPTPAVNNLGAPIPNAPVAGAAIASAQPIAPATLGANAVSQYSIADITAAAQGFAKANGPKAAKAVLAEYGLTKISDATAAQYPDLMKRFGPVA